MSDGAPINGAIANHLGFVQKRCLAHGVQFAIHDVFYKTDYQRDDDETHEIANQIELDNEDELGALAFGPNDDDEDDDDDEETQSTLQQSSQFNTNEIQSLINKIRKIVTYFKRSPVRNDEIQEYRVNCGLSKLNFVLDTPTRWNSLLAMLSRFDQMKSSVGAVLAGPFNDENLTPLTYQENLILQSLIAALTPMEYCIRSVCKESIHMFEAHIIIETVIEQLEQQQTEFARKLCGSLITRIQERISILYAIQLFLFRKEVVTQSKFFTFPTILVIKDNCLKILKKLSSFRNENDTNSNDNNEVNQLPAS